VDQAQRFGGNTALRIRLASLFLILVLLALPVKGWAQAAASISGKIEDETGAAVSGATVTVREMQTDAKRVANTDSSGHYHFLSLPVGLYELSAEKSGFQSEEWSGIRLNVGQEMVENLRLAVSGTTQEITVSATNPVVNTTTSSVSGVVGEQEIKDLPLNGRGFDSLITLNPGTVNYSALRSANTTTSNGNAFAVDGQKPGDNETLLNGVEYGGSSQLAVTPGGVSQQLLGVDAVQEFNMLTGTYGAEYGKRSGAQVSVVTKSGSNEVHGDAYEFLRNNVLDARNYFDLGANGPVSAPPFKQNQFGAALGGPLVKDKLFLFGNYEGFRQRENVTSVSFVPDACVRSGGIPNATGTCVPVAGALPKMEQYAREFWPLPNGPELGGGTATLYADPYQSINEDFGTTRLDYIVGPRDTLSGAYTIDQGNSLLPLADPYFASALDVGSQVFSLHETHIFSPQIVNAATFGFSRAAFANNSSPYPAFLAQYDPSLDFVAGRGAGGITFNGVSTTGPSGAVTAAGPNNASGVWNRRNIFTYTDNLQISKGIHQISLGVWFQRLQDNDDTASRLLGQATFSSLPNFLKGIASPFQVVPESEELGWRSLFGAWYVQDAMRVRHNLTVELGLRQEFDTGWNEAHGRAANYQYHTDSVTGLPDLNSSPTPGSSIFTQNNAKWLFGPRVALAWDPYGDGSTAVHAGFGTYYSLLDDLAYMTNAVSNGGYNGTYSYSGALFGAGEPLAGPINPAAPPAGNKISPQGVQPNAKTPTVEKWSLSLDQRLTNTTSLRIAYVGSFGYHEVVSIDPNSLVPVLCTTASGCTNAGGVATTGLPATPSSVPYNTVYIPVGTRPTPNLTSGFFWYTEGNSSYNALQVDVIKQFSQQLQFRANYTWSKSLDNNSAPTGAQANNEAQMILDRFDLRKDWGPSAFNTAQQAHFTATYQLPFGRGQHWLTNAHGVEDKLVSGWTFNTITTLLSGFPLTPQVGSNRSGDGDSRNPDRPNLNPSPVTPCPQQVNQWVDPCAYSLPLAGTYGNVSRGSLTGPGLVEMDVSLFKDTQLAEKVKLQFRAECFNVLNHTNFNTPNMTIFSNGAINPTAGQITSTATSSRQIQFGLKLIY
jgi:hypothetical protein